MGKVRTGLYGGSFNPIHNGHIGIAGQVVRQGLADEVWLMVSPQNPLKEQSALIDDTLRLDMARKAVEGMSGVVASDYEFALPRPSYTWNTLQSLGRDYPEREFSIVIGADNWNRFDRWYRAEDIIGRYRIIIYPRSGSYVDRGSLPPNATLIDMPLIDVSSTDIRQAIRLGQDISDMVPAGIAHMAKAAYAGK